MYRPINNPGVPPRPPMPEIPRPPVVPEIPRPVVPTAPRPYPGPPFTK